MIKKENVSILWESVDKVLFGGVSPEEKLGEQFMEYQIIKSSLIIEACEMIKFLKPESDKIPISITEDTVEKHVQFSKSTTKAILESEKLKNHITKDIKSTMKNLSESENINTDKLIEDKVKTTTLNILLDNLLMAKVLKESSADINQISDPLFDIVKDSYNLFKEDLVQLITK